MRMIHHEDIYVTIGINKTRDLDEMTPVSCP